MYKNSPPARLRFYSLLSLKIQRQIIVVDTHEMNDNFISLEYEYFVPENDYWKNNSA